MSFKSWFDSWSSLIGMILTLAGWIVVSLSNRSNNRTTVLLATKNQARIEISTALKLYLDYLHDIEDPAVATFGAISMYQLGSEQHLHARQLLEALEQLESRLTHDPRLGVGGLEILKGYIPLFPSAEEVMVDIQLSQYGIDDDLDGYFERTKQLVKKEGLPGQTVPTSVLCEDAALGFARTGEEKDRIWSQISIVNNFVEHLNFTVLKDLTKTRGRWIWTGNREYFSHMDNAKARLWSDRHNNPHVRRWDDE